MAGPSQWRAERVRQVMGLVAKHGCERRQVEPALASGRDSWMYKEGFNLHDELFHDTLRPIDDPTFAYNFVGSQRLSRSAFGSWRSWA